MVYDNGMKPRVMILMASLLLSVLSAHAGIRRVAEGGVEINVSDLLAAREPGVLVFHATWDTASVNLLADLEYWAQQVPGLDIVLIDVVDERTQVYRQFDLKKIPSIVIMDREHEAVGSPVQDINEMEGILRENGFL